MSCVCDVHVEYIRSCGYKDLQHWMTDDNNVYVARRGVILLNNVRFPPANSIWANPYKVDKDGTLTEVLQKYWFHLCKLLTENPQLFEELKKLKGKRLGCWCVKRTHVDSKDLNMWVCHAQILAYFVNYFYP